MQIKQQIIPKSRKTQRPGIAMIPQFITIHSTGNPSSTAQNEADYVCKNSVRQASFHFVCDEKQVIQVIPTNEIAWHAGDGGSGTGNRKSIAIEICESGNRKAAVDNAVQLTKQLIDEFKIQPGNVFQHHHWSGKNCPRILRDNKYIKDRIDWKYFTAKIREEEEEMTQEQFNDMMENYLASRAQKAPHDWSAADRKWAEENGIIQGDPDGDKRYQSFITREEAAAMMRRTANLQ